mgnify:CR=1 FL=1
MTFEVALEGDEEEPDEDAPVQYEVTCPDCGTTAVFEEEELLEGEPKCPNCGEPLYKRYTPERENFISILRRDKKLPPRGSWRVSA